MNGDRSERSIPRSDAPAFPQARCEQTDMLHRIFAYLPTHTPAFSVRVANKGLIPDGVRKSGKCRTYGPRNCANCACLVRVADKGLRWSKEVQKPKNASRALALQELYAILPNTYCTLQFIFCKEENNGRPDRAKDAPPSWRARCFQVDCESSRLI